MEIEDKGKKLEERVTPSGKDCIDINSLSGLEMDHNYQIGIDKNSNPTRIGGLEGTGLDTCNECGMIVIDGTQEHVWYAGELELSASPLVLAQVYVNLNPTSYTQGVNHGSMLGLILGLGLGVLGTVGYRRFRGKTRSTVST